MASAANLNTGKDTAASAGILNGVFLSPRNRMIAILAIAIIVVGIGLSGFKPSDIANFFERSSSAMVKAAKASGNVPLSERFAALLDQRSPGERTAGELANNKHRYAQVGSRTRPHQRALAKTRPGLPAPFVEALTTPTVEFVPVPVPTESLFTPLAENAPVPVAVISPPVIGGGGGGGGGPPPNPPTPPTDVPSVPEPATWLTMILGFYLCARALRNRRVAVSRAGLTTA